MLAALGAFSQAAHAITYEYDPLNRLTGVVYDDGTTIAYTYDKAGNRLSRIVSKDRDGDGVPYAAAGTPCVGGVSAGCEGSEPRPSMGTAGDAYYSATAERSAATLSCKPLDPQRYATQIEVVTAVVEWPQRWYNPRRLHASTEYLSPNEFERDRAEGERSGGSVPCPGDDKLTLQERLAPGRCAEAPDRQRTSEDSIAGSRKKWW